MRIAVVVILSLAAMTVAGAADEAIDSKVTGKIEAVDSKVSGTITINFAPAPLPKETDKLEECGAEWNKKFAAYEKARKEGANLTWLSRLDYRTCMYQCLEGHVVAPRKCKADELPAGPASGQPSRRPAGW